MSTGKIELSVGTMKISNKYEIFTEEEIDAINNKIPELDERVGIIEDEIEEINSSLEDMESEKATKSEVDLERKRIDNLAKLGEGSTTGDAELIDGRIGADGEVYTNIGSAIRTQISNITDKVETLEGNITPAFIQGGYIQHGKFVEDSRYETTDYILVPQGTTITINNFIASTGVDMISLYDANTKDFIKSIKKGEGYETSIEETFMIESSCLIRISRFIDTKTKKCEITINNYNTQKAICALENNIKTVENNINDIQNSIDNDLLICLNDRVIDDTHAYYNADNVPVGKIIGYGNSGINVPSTVGTLMCFEGTSINGRCQMFVDRYGVLYNRTRWNNVWLEWVSTETKLTKSMLETFRCLLPMGRTTADMSCDTLPVNSVYIVTTSITNLPVSETMGVIVTLGGETRANASGIIQMFISPEGDLYTRVNWSSNWISWTHINKPVDTSDTSDTLITDRDYYASFSLFETIGVVGDSYASGASGESESDTVAYDHPEISWPQILGRRNGVSVTNYAQGGMSTRSFLTNTNFGMTKLLSDTARGLYILALIRNDYNIENRGETGYIGSISDITNNSLDNYPDTFFGNYATIIEKIKTHAPYSKIVLMTADYKTNNILGTAYNSAMQEIAEHYSLPIMIQLDEAFFSSDYYRRDWASGGHPSAIIYSGMELAIERMFNKCVNEYKSYFTYYKGISGNNGDSSIDG